MAVTFLTNEDKTELEAAIEEVRELVSTDSDSSQNGNGLDSSASALLITILRNGMYNTDQSANITSLENALTSGESGDSGESGGDETHTHSYTAAVTTAATCETAGVRTYTCSCGDTYTEEIPATGHDYADGTCTVCGSADPDYEPSENNGWTENEAYAIEWTEGYGIDQLATNETFGEAVENSARSVSNYLPCLGASAVMIGTGIYKNYGVYFYDGEKKLIQRVNAAYEYPVPAPLNAHYVRVQCITPAGENSTVTPITYPEHSETTVWTAGEYFSAPHNEVGSINTDTGAVSTTQTAWLATGFVFCFGAVTLKVNAFTNQYRSQVCYYDADKNVISGATYTGNTWTIPENAQYFRHAAFNGDQYNTGHGHNNPWFTLE